MYGDFFNTVKKGPGKAVFTTIDPPREFQDILEPVGVDNPTVLCVSPSSNIKNESVNNNAITSLEVSRGNKHPSPLYPRYLKPESFYERHHCLNHRIASPRLLHLSPCRTTRPSSRNSLSSRLSSSHNSLVTQFQADDSSFITQAISHDTLSAKTSDITDLYNVPFDSDIYAVPVDMIRPQNNLKSKKSGKSNKKRGNSTPQNMPATALPTEKNLRMKEGGKSKETKTKRFSLPGSSKKNTEPENGPKPLTMVEIQKYLNSLYANPHPHKNRLDSIRERNGTFVASFNLDLHRRTYIEAKPANVEHKEPRAGTAVFLTESIEVSKTAETNNNHKKSKNSFCVNTKSKKHKETNQKERDLSNNDKPGKKMTMNPTHKEKMSPVRILSINLKQSFCNLFRWRRHTVTEDAQDEDKGDDDKEGFLPAAVRRALPPLPRSPQAGHSSRRSANEEDNVTDFATSIEKVKDYGWYWGPLSVEAAEKVLSNEPDGSFIVRDSSDDHYIFTLTFKLNGLRHVRIEHDQGNFCFGGCTMFKAQTIVEFIENAVETSRSGRYLFFLNLRPLLGPVRVQLLYPVSRFKRVQSLQHMCRFVILKNVRRDLIGSLPLPRRLLDYLSANHYYSELLADA
ncbi:uncharacterized protein LOC113227476 isoform X2 [Hyposmocoma kahamanoa]|nr:uncharacterized protein LOC113227476 isoform X2 [Hyposmocoma kahamanoa]